MTGDGLKFKGWCDPAYYGFYVYLNETNMENFWKTMIVHHKFNSKFWPFSWLKVGPKATASSDHPWPRFYNIVVSHGDGKRHLDASSPD